MLRTVCLLFLLCLSACAFAQIHVAVNGSDRGDGSLSNPLATVSTALRKARELRRLQDTSISGGIHIYIGSGIYHFSEPLFIRPEDAGTAASPTTIEAFKGEKVIFSGGIQVLNWKKATPVKGLPSKASGKIWVADMPDAPNGAGDFRQLWVNDKKAVRAKDINGDSMNRILSWDHKAQQCWIPKPRFDIEKVKGMEMTIQQWWAIANLRIRGIVIKGDSALLQFYQPESSVQSEHPWPAPWISSETGNSAFFLSNAIQFLDEPGEWFLEKTSRKIYYWPRAGENMQTASVIMPILETIVRMEGTIDNPVKFIQFNKVSFQHTTWMRPSKQGHVPHQAGMYMLDAYKLKTPGTADKKTLENQAWVGRPAAAVSISYADNIRFENCRFEHLGSTALDFDKGVHHSSITGNLFRDIGGTAILAGHFSDESREVHLPYLPNDEREVSSHFFIANNLINDAANEDWGCVGIGAGYIHSSTIEHNDLSELPYMGISMGWGWSRTPNVMKNNKVVANKIQRFARHLYDVGGIYTLSAQPGTTISENYIDSAYKAPYAHLPSHWFYIYTDEGSSGILVKDNWTPSQKFLQNANGPGNSWVNNGPMAGRNTRQRAGLLPSFQHLLKEKKILYPGWGIVHELPVIIEVVSKNDNINTEELRSVLRQNNVNPNALYQWKDRVVVFDKVQDVSVLKGKLQEAFPEQDFRIYYDAFYEFNRSHCSDTVTAKEWDHIILTANLVDDKKLQQEYLNYHSQQFKQWPEVSRGFCNASFQQLLLYRNGRQLMLVISIPKGDGLDKLNPKTTENNPRVDEWNQLMKKYQEGIKGTKPGEVWVFFEKIK